AGRAVSLRDPAARLRSVSALRALCLALPRVPRLAESRRLDRLRALAAAPESATIDDRDALPDGWRDWWRGARIDDPLATAARGAVFFVEDDRRLSSHTVAVAAREHGHARRLARGGAASRVDPAAAESVPQNPPLEARS